MQFEIRHLPRGWHDEGYEILVRFNGVYIMDCYAASEEEGWVDVFDRRMPTQYPIPAKYIDHESGEPARKRLYGEVRIFTNLPASLVKQ